MKRKILIPIITTVLVVVLFGQNSKSQGLISGRISLVNGGEYLSNSNIHAIKNNISVTTNSKGMFSIQLVAFPDTLEISHVGYSIERIPITGSQTNLSVSLTPTTSELEEVILNTGYQRSRPNEVTGSVTVIDNKTLNQQTGTNILKRLENVTSGLAFNPGYGNNTTQKKTDITIRGLSTINGPLDPLIVLDNFIYEGDIRNINPNDIESITILKDAAATSIWGARAGNGVIVLTSKKSRFNQKLQIELNSNIIVTQKPNLSSLPEISIAEYIDMEQFLFSQNHFDDIIAVPYQPLTPATEIFLKRRNGLISAADSAEQINALKNMDSRKQFSKYFYQDAITLQNSITVKNGTDKVAWLLSAAYDRNIDNLHSTYDKLNVRVNNTFKATKNLSVNVAAFYTSSKSGNGKPSYSSVNNIGGRYVPYLQYADASGTPLPVSQFYRSEYTDTAGAGKLLDWKYYPLEDYKHNRGSTNMDEIVANIGMTYQLVKPLQLSFNYQYHKQRSTTEQNAGLQSFDTRNTINLFSQLDRATGKVKYIVPMGDILTIGNANISSQNIRGQFNYNKAWKTHSLSAIGGMELREVITNNNESRFYGYHKNPLSWSVVDNVNTYPTFITGDFQTISGAGGMIAKNSRFVSVYANLSYTYNGRYMLYGSFRKDGSNILGVKTNDKWKPLWSAGLGWELSKENFYKLSWLPYLKLRTTYGYSGNVDLSRTALPVAGYGTDQNTGLPAASISTINNPELRWEKARQTNFGADFAGKNGRITGSIDFYFKQGIDLYAKTPYDYTTWGQSGNIIKNVANMKGHGIDLMLQTMNIDKAVKWSTNFLYSYTISKTSKYFENSANSISTLLGGGQSITPVIGKPLYAIAAYKWGGLDNAGNPQGFLNGELSTDYSAIASEAYQKGESDNIVYKGSALPTSFGAIINTISWKQLAVSVNISYKLGYYFRKPTVFYESFVSNGYSHKDFTNRWQKPGDELITTIPSFVFPTNSARDNFYAVSEVNILKADHIRLQYINLNYSFNKTGNKLSFDLLQLYVNVAGFGVLWRANKYGIDPDNPGGYSVPKSFTFGVRATF